MDRNWLDSRRKRVAGVALRKESVDRKHDVIKVGNALCGRSPQGERG